MEALKIDSPNASIGCGYDEERIQSDGEVIAKSDVERFDVLEPKHKVFLSHSGAQKEQKDFVEQLCVDLERWDIYPFFDKRQRSLPIGVKFPNLIFEAIEQCLVGVLVFSKEFFYKTKWPMLELVAMVRESKKWNIKIIPVFFFMSWDDWIKKENHELWIEKWEEWAKEDKRIDVEEWKEALRALKPISSLVRDITSAVSCRKEIVEVIRRYVLPETRWDVSCIEGRLRLCKDIKRKIDEREVRNGIRVMGLYGMGGMGKTSICKAMCNESWQKFKGRVCHIEMESTSEVELLREALKRLTNVRGEVLDDLNIDKCRDQLKRCVVKEPVFLAVDNVSGRDEVLRLAKIFLEVKWGEGSEILVTARSLGELMCLRQHIWESECVEMPELEECEAKSLFLKNAGLEGAATEMDQEVLKRCIRRCYFSKGEGKGSHYIPLALQVLGEQLGRIGYGGEAWDARLRMIDTFKNEMSGDKHPIFSILRTSYDCLSDEAKLLFMDVAKHVSWRKRTFSYRRKWNDCEWLGVVHGISVEVVMSRLEGLNRKSLLEDLGDGGWREIVMHDLWLEFCMAETKAGKLGNRWWVYLEEDSRELGERSPGGGCWEKVRRMCLVGEGWRSLHGVRFSEFANVAVLRVEVNKAVIVPSALDLDVSGLRHLKSLELRTHQFFSKIVGLGLLKNLVYLSWIREYASNSACIEEIGHLTKLEVLELEGFTNAEMPDLSMLRSLREAWLSGFWNTVTVRGLSSKLSKLRVLVFDSCFSLQECPGLGDLYALEELGFSECSRLEEVPCLRRLRSLRELKIGLRKLKAVPGLGDLAALQTLEVEECSRLTNFGDMLKLTELRVLKVTRLAGMDALDVGVFQRLERISVSGWDALKSVTCSSPLCALKIIWLTCCYNLEAIPDLSNFPQLEELYLKYCAALMSLTSSAPLHALKILDLTRCGKLTALPNHLNSSENLEELRLAESGIVLSEEDIRNLKASCRALRVPAVSADDATVLQGKSNSLAKRENACSESGTACPQDMDDSDEELQDVGESDEELQDMGESDEELDDMEVHSCDKGWFQQQRRFPYCTYIRGNADGLGVWMPGWRKDWSAVAESRQWFVDEE